MGRSLTLIALMLAAASSGETGASPFGPPQGAYTARTDAVLVDVEVHSDGQNMLGLQATDFHLRDNGVEQDVQLSDAAALPLDVLVIVDNSGPDSAAARRKSLDRKSLDQQSLAEVRAAMALLRPGDQLGVLTAAPTGRVLIPLSPVPVSIPSNSYPGGGFPRLLDALAEALLVPGRPGRHRWIVVQTTGLDILSVVDPKTFLTIAAQSDANVDVTFKGSSPSNRHDVLVETAHLTGGRILAGKDLASSFKEMLASFNQAYTLTYVPKGVPSGGWHTISVSIARPGDFVVGARRGYMRQ